MKLGRLAILNSFATTWQAYRGEALSCDELAAVTGPNSVDVTLDHRFLRPWSDSGFVDPYHPDDLIWQQIITEPNTPLCLRPGEFLLGAVRERFVATAPVQIAGADTYFAQMYEGRSTCGRIGLASHVTAGFGDYGFEGAFTLELVNHSPFAIFLWAGMRIGQVAFEAVVDPGPVYRGAYSTPDHRSGPMAPVLGRGRFDITSR